MVSRKKNRGVGQPPKGTKEYTPDEAQKLKDTYNRTGEKETPKKDNP
jgi:hypothetical protein